jgi:hypothetical protein
MIGYEALDARDFVEWRVAVLAAHQAGLPVPPAPRPQAVASLHEGPAPVSDAAECVGRLIEAQLAARVIVGAVGRA